MHRMTMMVVLCALPAALGCASRSTPPLEVVPHVDVPRYMGTWHEIARYPMRFQKDCVDATAEYTLRADGKVTVVNRCRACKDGEEKSVRGVARVVDTCTNAKLKVGFSFFPLAEGDYWIIDLDPEYRWAVVGEPRRKYLWILARTPTLEAGVYHQIVARLPSRGYSPEPLITNESMKR